jgi:hypothetical protein
MCAAALVWSFRSSPEIRSVDNQPGSVVVVAFDGSKSWMQVTERVAQDGW